MQFDVGDTSRMKRRIVSDGLRRNSTGACNRRASVSVMECGVRGSPDEILQWALDTEPEPVA